MQAPEETTLSLADLFIGSQVVVLAGTGSDMDGKATVCMLRLACQSGADMWQINFLMSHNLTAQFVDVFAPSTQLLR